MKRGSAKKSKTLAVLTAAQEALVGLEQSLRAIEGAVALIQKRKGDILVTGIGKTRLVGEKFTASLTSLGQRAFFIHPTEALHGDLGMLSRGDVLIALSFSGETKEVVDIARYAKKTFKVPIVALCKSQTSSLGRIADHCVPLPVKREGSPNDIAPMASTTVTLVACDMIAAALMQDDFKEKHFASYHPGGTLGLRLKKVKDVMKTGSAIPKIGESASFLRAVQEISKKELGVVGVINALGSLRGIITDGDVRRFVLKHKDIGSAKAADAMTRSPKCIRSDDTLEQALAVMEEFKITNMFVVDARGALVGVVHVHDILGHAMA